LTCSWTLEAKEKEKNCFPDKIIVRSYKDKKEVQNLTLLYTRKVVEKNYSSVYNTSVSSYVPTSMIPNLLVFTKKKLP
jgi:hypothetical protein